MRGRVGILAIPSLLAYATGGLAYGETKLSASYRQVCINCSPLVGGLSAAFAESETRVGWTLGGGAEWLVAPKRTVKAEYLYYDLGTTSVTTLVPGFGFNGLPFLRHSPTVESRSTVTSSAPASITNSTKAKLARSRKTNRRCRNSTRKGRP